MYVHVSCIYREREGEKFSKSISYGNWVFLLPLLVLEAGRPPDLWNWNITSIKKWKLGDLFFEIHCSHQMAFRTGGVLSFYHSVSFSGSFRPESFQQKASDPAICWGQKWYLVESKIFYGKFPEGCNFHVISTTVWSMQAQGLRL